MDSTKFQTYYTVVTMCISPAVTGILKAIFGERLSGLSLQINAGVNVVSFLALWAISGHAAGELDGYLLAAAATTLAGSTGVDFWDKVSPMLKRKEPLAESPLKLPGAP